MPADPRAPLERLIETWREQDRRWASHPSARTSVFATRRRILDDCIRGLEQVLALPAETPAPGRVTYIPIDAATLAGDPFRFLCGPPDMEETPAPAHVSCECPAGRGNPCPLTQEACNTRVALRRLELIGETPAPETPALCNHIWSRDEGGFLRCDACGEPYYGGGETPAPETPADPPDWIACESTHRPDGWNASLLCELPQGHAGPHVALRGFHDETLWKDAPADPPPSQEGK